MRRADTFKNSICRQIDGVDCRNKIARGHADLKFVQGTAMSFNRVNPERYREWRGGTGAQQGDGPQIDINLSVHGNRIARVMAFLRRRETRPRSQLFVSRGSRAAIERRLGFLRRLAPPPLATPELKRSGDGPRLIVIT